MKWERRKKTASANPEIKVTELPFDYLRLVEQTLNQTMLKGLIEIKKIHPISEFYVDGALLSDEVLLIVTLSHGPNVLAATTVYASADFNPNLTQPDPLAADASDEVASMRLPFTLENTLGACVDAASTIFDYYLDPAYPERIEQIANHSMLTLEEAPFEWSPFEKTKPQVWVKMDKSNPKLEALTDEWLKKNDPNYSETAYDEATLSVEAETFLEERIDAIKKSRDGNTGGGSPFGGGSSGPIRH